MNPCSTLRPQVGQSIPRVDAWPKVTGQIKYATDFYHNDFLWAGVKRSEIAHGRLLNIHTETAKQIPGLVAILTHHDITGSNRQNVIHHDQPVLVDDRVRRVGDALALVLAENKEALKQALTLINVDIEPFPGVFDPPAALAPDAPLIHDHAPGNRLASVDLIKGDPQAVWATCPVQVHGRFQTHRQEHAYLETEAGWAYTDENGRTVIVAGTQAPFRDVHEISVALGVPPDQIRVIAPYLGGAFGGKDGVNVQPLLALAVKHSRGKPVKMWWDREESFLASVKRVPAIIDYRLGADGDGNLLALECQVTMDAGAYDHLCGEIMGLAVEHAGGPYRVPHVKVQGQLVYTNNPPGGPFRGFGVPQITAALEQMMDILAAKMPMDPVQLRLKNLITRGEQNAAGVTLTGSIGARECLEKLANHPWWHRRQVWKNSAGPFKKRGLGLACLVHGAGYGPLVPDYAQAKVELTLDGRFLVDAPVPDMGQGNASTYLQIAADLLNQDFAGLELVLPDTDLTLPSCSSAASRTTFTYGQALIGACEQMKNTLLETTAARLMISSSAELSLVPGRIRHLTSGREIPLAQIAHTMTPIQRTRICFWRAPVAKDKIKVKTSNVVGLPHRVFSYAAHLALVEVDQLTGQVQVHGYLAVTDAGRVLNPQIYEQQIQGAVGQGLGFALYEDYQVESGHSLTPDLTTYILPTALDLPDMESRPVQTHEPDGPFGQKGVGEISINGPLPAVANAVADACGVRAWESPLTPERVLAVLNKNNKSGRR